MDKDNRDFKGIGAAAVAPVVDENVTELVSLHAENNQELTSGL